MALTVMDRFRPYRNLGGGGMPSLEVHCEAATTWSQGALIIHDAAGYADAAADAPAPAVILGVALHAVVADETTGLIVPALPGVTFWGRLATGATGTTVVSAVEDRYVSGDAAAYDIYLGAVDVYFLNEAATANPQAVILNFIDVIGTAFGAVEWTFASSAFNAVA
jgi:hypothetical protein